MSSLFCCSSIQPYRPRILDHEAKFTSFMAWASFPKATSESLEHDDEANLEDLKIPYAVQLVRQVNYGPLEGKHYFVATEQADKTFTEVTEDALIKLNFQKLNSYKNFRCTQHNKFFEVNLYQKHPTNKHHWRMDLARPSGSIDL